MEATQARGRGRPRKQGRSVEELLNQTAVLNLTDTAMILGMDPSTVLRKEREGLLPKRRDVAGRLMFRTADIRALINDAPAVDGPDPERSGRQRKSRELALARSAGKKEAA